MNAGRHGKGRGLTQSQRPFLPVEFTGSRGEELSLWVSVWEDLVSITVARSQAHCSSVIGWSR